MSPEPIRTPGVFAVDPVESRLQTARVRPDDDPEAHAAPAAAGRVHRPGGAARAARRLDRGRLQARRGARPRAAAGPARPGQDVAGADRGRRARRAVRADRRPRARAQGRHRGVPDRARAAHRVLRGRDPPAAARGRGDLLSRDGGPPAADHGRRGRGRAGRHARPAAVHARRRHHALRPADDAAARPVRHPAPARPLRAGRPGPDRRAQRARARDRDRRRTARERSPSAPAAPRAWPTGCSSACATSRRSAAAA